MSLSCYVVMMSAQLGSKKGLFYPPAPAQLLPQSPNAFWEGI